MLNIPDSVKALFKQDGVHKNFRAHFPNGELADITNENIVQESVKFTESVCSQDVFKFGLTEASTIEFETVGVANMYGMTIECSCEIDCSSLSAADQATIAAGTWDGTWDSVNEVFAVPYGTFRVESCPRDHQAMTHRKVTAYTPEGGKLTNPFEEWKVSRPGVSSEYILNPTALAISTIAYRNPSIVSAMVGFFTELSMPYGSPSTIYSLYELKKSDGTQIIFRVTYEGQFVNFLSSPQMDDPFNLNKVLVFENVVEPTQIEKNAVYSEITRYLNARGVDAEQSGWDSLNDIAIDVMENRWGTHVYYPYMGASGSGAYFYTTKDDVFPLPIGNSCIYPRYVHENINSFISSSDALPQIMLATKIGLEVKIGGSADYGYPQNVNVQSYNNCPTVKYAGRPGSQNYNITCQNTHSEKETRMGARAKRVYTFIDSFSVDEITRGIAEINAWFMKPSRSSGYDVLRLSSASPVSVPPGEYSQMWFDEYNVEPIGTIRYSYTDEAGEEQVVDYQFGEGASVYDVSDNEVLKLMDGADPSVIEAMLDAFFIPNIAPVNFVPIDLNMKGLPCIEAGDALSVTAQDGTVCASYALRQEISGIQALEAQIDSQSGLIIESEAGA